MPRLRFRYMQACNSAPLRSSLTAACGALSEDSTGADKEAEDAWVSFLQRWQYDDEQLDRVSEALELCREEVPTGEAHAGEDDAIPL